MDKKPDFCDIPLMPRRRTQPDDDPENQNNNYGLEHGDSAGLSSERPPVFKLISLITAVVFTVLVMGNWFKLFNMPALDFLRESTELAQNPEIQKLQEAVVTIKTGGQKGTGFNIDPRGLVITNYHVVEEAKFIDVLFSDGPEFTGKKWTGLPELDLAVIKIEGKNLPLLKLASDFNPKPGDELLIIGNPLVFSGVANKVTVTGMARLKNWEEPVIMFKGPVHKGHSGSPVFNREGQVVAVIFAALPPEENSQKQETTGLAVPANYILNFVKKAKL